MASSVTLAWNPDPDPIVVGYFIYYGTLSGVYPNVVYCTNTSVTISNLNSGVKYYFMATALGNDGVQSLPSDEVSFTIPNTWDPGLNLTATATNAGVALSWSATNTDNIVGYNLRYGATNGSFNNAIYLDGVANANTTVTNLAFGTTYYFQVNAVDINANESLPSNVASNSVLFSFNSIVLQANALDTQSVALVWSRAGDPSQISYVLYYGTSLTPDNYITSLPGSVTSDTVTGLAAGTTYYFMVTATNSSLMISTNSNVASTNVPSTIVNAPSTNLQLSLYPTDAAGRNVMLVWTQYTGANFQTYYLYDANGSDNSAYIYDVTSTNFTFAGLTPGASYAFILDVNDPSLASSAVTNYTVPLPGKPSDIVCTATTNSIAVTWVETDTNVVEYSISGGQDQNSYELAGVRAANTAATNWTIYGIPGVIDPLNPGTVYYFTVYANDGVGGDAASSKTFFSAHTAPSPSAPAAPVLLYATPTTNSVTLVWADSDPNIEYFTVYNGTNLCNPYQNSSPQPPYDYPIPGTSSTYTVTNLTPGTTNYFVVEATAANYNNSFSSVLTAITTVSNAPAAPASFQFTPSINSITLNWQADPNVGYLIYYGASIIDCTPYGVASVNLSSSPGNNVLIPGFYSLTIPIFVAGTANYFFIGATNAAGATAFATVVAPTYPVLLISTGSVPAQFLIYTTNTIPNSWKLLYSSDPAGTNWIFDANNPGSSGTNVPVNYTDSYQPSSRFFRLQIGTNN